MAAIPAPLGPAELEAALGALLAEYPTAFVAAINEDGLFIPMPAAVPLAGQQLLHARSTLETVIPEDRELVIATWERARHSGAASAHVRLALDPQHPAVIHYLDVRASHGAYLVVLVGGDAAALTGLPDVKPAPPRIARVRKNEVAVYVEVDQATTAILGWTAEEVVGRRSLEFVHPDDQTRAIENWMQMLSAPGSPQRPVRLRHRRADNAWVWFEMTNLNRLGDPAHGDVLAEMIDISDEMAAHEAVRAREQLLHRLAETLPIGVFQALSDRRVVYANDRLRTILGVERSATVDAQLATVSSGDRPLLEAALAAALDDGIDADLEVQVRPPQATRPRRCMLRLRALTDEQGAATGAIVCVEDVTESAQLRAELERRATHDMLTRVMNRASVMAALEGALARKTGGRTAAIFVDLDHFKEVNDRLGHLAGDELLRIVADRLAISVRAGDALGRVGGDEFLVVCPGLAGADPATRVAERLARALNQPVRLAGATLELQASLGVAYAGRRSVNADALVRRADAAMYASKRDGHGRPVLYSSALARGLPAADKRQAEPGQATAGAY
jgi:diguanylate cyclase (GGDEF)-like protein/PAS domain S-box-containing protein